MEEPNVSLDTIQLLFALTGLVWFLWSGAGIAMLLIGYGWIPLTTFVLHFLSYIWGGYCCLLLIKQERLKKEEGSND